ncbi:MAG TPA: hypothetical protein VGP82_17765 [Ktedonobacterales bacterium]|jgi:hypothetical protein|nr:hypothetical protein [Ktedonobacterales bacterium]
MTQQQATALAKALERAHTNGLQVRGHGPLKLDGARFLAIDSATLPNVWHIVVIREGRLECDREASCARAPPPASRPGARDAERDALLASERWSLTEKGAIALAQHKVQQNKRETSGRQGPRAFSLLK